ncbi:MAG: disulfide bond formation protein B [Fimbriimonadaceae bacterium]|nr:disulfide bond formation protein B [Alphaproteobacteria bacterium]
MREPDEALKFQTWSLLTILVVSSATIAGAWAFQIIIDLVPCPLCFQGRWHHYAGIPLSLITLLLLRPNPRLARLGTILVGLVFLAGALFSVYHAGIEYGFWPGPESCATGAGSPTSAGSLLTQMQSTKVVACDEAAWTFLGISLAGYNALISFALAGLAFKAVSEPK